MSDKANKTVEPMSDPVEASDAKTELRPSAPAVIPSRLSDGISTIGDAEAGASLGDLLPSLGESSETSPEAAKVRDETADVSDEVGIASIADAEAGVIMSDVVPTSRAS